MPVIRATCKFDAALNGILEQCGLTHPGFAMQDQGAAEAVAGRVDQSIQRCSLLITT